MLGPEVVVGVLLMPQRQGGLLPLVKRSSTGCSSLSWLSIQRSKPICTLPELRKSG